MTNVSFYDCTTKYHFSQSIQIIFIVLFIIAGISAAPALSIPQFALLKGNRCITCHTNSQGAGLRNARGRSIIRNTGMFKSDTISSINEKLNKGTSLLHNPLQFGTDVRFQMARSHKSKDANRRFFPMQAALYSTYEIAEWLDIEGSYNFGPKKYPGQQKWTASAIIQPKALNTLVRIGYFQPSIGIRYDDHTTLTRQIGGADGTTLIPPNYAEFGGEISFNGIQWVTITAGVFDTESLAENLVINNSGVMVPLIDDKHNISGLGRLEVRKQLNDNKMTLTGGSSVLKNNNFYLMNIFCGAGFRDRLSVMSEYSRSEKEDLRITNNFFVEMMYELYDPLLLSIRGERAVTNETFSGLDIESYSNQGVIGAQIFVIPSVVLRPEYRLLDTEHYRSTRVALQLHMFL